MLNKVTIFGSSGKMNNALIEIMKKRSIEYEQFKRASDVKNNLSGQIIIDFSVIEASVPHFNLAEKYKKPILICTTGHKDLRFFENPSVPVCYAPNTCLNWLIIKRCAIEIKKNAEEDNIVVDDIHSISKRDSPSGTALNLVNSLNESPDIIRSIRGPQVASWHKVSFYNQNQVINLEHQVLDRKVYALGAISLARKLILKSPGTYQPEDLLF